MLKISSKQILVSSIIFTTLVAPCASYAQVSSSDLLDQIKYYSQQESKSSIAQANNILQWRDASARDWGFQPLRNLVDRYNCIAGYPDGSYRGERALTRYEFAAGLNSCLQSLERIVQSGTTSDRRATNTEEFYPTSSGINSNLTIPEKFEEAFFKNSGITFTNDNIGRQLNTMFGFGAFPEGSFPENSIRRDARQVDRLYQELLEQQNSSDPVLRTRDLANPYNSSIMTDPDYTYSQ
jgi:hypothetical protein